MALGPMDKGQLRYTGNKMPLEDHQPPTDESASDCLRPQKRGSTMVIAILALTGVASVLLGHDDAGARGGGNPAAMMVPEAAPATSSVYVKQPATRTRQIPAPSLGLSVCVRLCDGFFFPSNTATGGDASCSAQCPDAPTAMYRERIGSDSIDDATSTTGAAYGALPVAGRFRTIADETCTCHRAKVNYSKLVLQDPTLRRGDMVMTPRGLVVYEGSGVAAIRWKDFVAVAQAPSAPGRQRADLSKLRSNSSEGWGVLSEAPANSPLGVSFTR